MPNSLMSYSRVADYLGVADYLVADSTVLVFGQVNCVRLKFGESQSTSMSLKFP
jgi:hypothetical protein